MPLPVILLGGAAAVSAAVGLKKGYDAYTDARDAKKLGEDARLEYAQATARLEAGRKATQTILEELGRVKITICAHQIRHLLDLYREHGDGTCLPAILDEAGGVSGMEAAISRAQAIEEQSAKGDVSALCAAMGAAGNVEALVPSHKKARIVGLSGLAAKGAAAWIGGGAIAHGASVAGGIMLGGIAIAPLMTLGAIVVAGEAEKNLDAAKKYAVKVHEAVVQMAEVCDTLADLRGAAREQKALLEEEAALCDAVMAATPADAAACRKMAAVGRGLWRMLHVQVLSEDGTVNTDVVRDLLACREPENTEPAAR